ncbi:hypothetical protein [Chitinophaga varians]|uniref:hypothetical protein n=1 Tax=Chitinophaga varians TaxID=2202339 RepID=UPI00165F19D8|nr:hypothetical protein [Chitinophaga varians]MBC9914991.1 hypothetical protein [Chitinophaga varians]
MEVIIRDFNIDDTTSLAGLTHQLGYPTTAAEMSARMEMISQNPDYKTAVAVLGSNVVGYVGINRQWFWEQNGCFVRIQGI